ncbi:MAG: choice-of-anchor D domain-containing protein [FCB group bacterium]|nr:choice-of-anchor D domain-containing protein [FCB group bacterium]MBL7029248.1 choice-of-anchor D domain-containing protein [Candidatus Neomarinimicrobiota bacterium]MBL7123006.1 choice-of-anchor D domain-containing protein [Candidatus Neomarinimicrobiota bacterium]
MTLSQAIHSNNATGSLSTTSDFFNTRTLYVLSFLFLFVLFGTSTEASGQCASTGNAADGYFTGIRQVVFNTIDNSTALEDNDYSDFTTLSTTLSRDFTYDLSVYVNTDGNYTVNTMAWIDWNQDLDFDDAGEAFTLGTATNVVSGLTGASPYSITIPAGATLGTTTMRISTKWNAYPGSCDNGFDGEVEDYSINIVLAPEINVQGNAIDIVDGDTSPTVSDDTDFGSVYDVSGSIAHTFTIYNNGGGDLALSGAPLVNISGINSSDFSVTTQPGNTISGSGGSEIFIISFDPGGLGLRSATVSIANNDLDENPYTFDIQGTGSGPPEADVSGNSTSIFDGDTSPSVNDDTFFGSADIVTGVVSHTFTISNSGSSSLTLSGSPAVVISGTHAADFSVTTQPAASVGPSGGTDDFVVSFDPSASGSRTATISISNNDPDENPYTFNIQGTGSATPEMDITGNGVSISDGNATPSPTDDSEFGNTDINGGSSIHTFSINNSGSGDLTLSGSPRVSVFGTHASEYTVSQQPASATVTAQGGTQTFEITFDPPATGLRQATVSITNDDADENPYTFDIQGTGIINSEIDILGNGVSIASGASTLSIADSTDFGDVVIGGSSHIITYSIQNTGPAPLNLTGSWPLVAISGTHAGDYSVVSAPSTPIASSGSSTFQIAFDPLTSGTRSATLTILNNDPDEESYSFAIQGNGTGGGTTLCEIDVQGNLNSIPQGESFPNTSDGTDFGSVSVTSGTLSQTFMINNTGTEDLLLTSSPLVAISGAHATDFSITLMPSSPVAPSGAVPFNVSFNPSSAGLRTAVISIENNDADENPFAFTVQGFGLTYPEIEVRGNDNIISSGDATPSLSDSTDFGDVHPVLVKAYATYTIYNTEDSTLALTGNPLVELGGSAAGEFTVTSMPSTSISAGGSSDFTIEFDPAQTGTRNVSISIPNNDSNETPYTFWLTGYGKIDGTPFPCISRFFHIWGDNGDVAAMDATVNPYVYDIAHTVGYHINGVGYNIEDGMLYAFEQDGDVSGNKIIRIDGNYNEEVLSVTVPFLSWRADFDVLGNFYFWDAAGTTVGIFDASAGTITTQATSGTAFLPIDVAYLDADGYFYGIHGTNLYVYNPSSHVVSTTAITGRLTDDYNNSINSLYYGAAWTADDGYIFTTNSQSGKMYKIDPSGLSIYVGQGEADLNKSDGASCPLVPAPLPSTGSIGDFVWVDDDADGIQDANEPGMAGVTVDLYSIDNTLLASTITDQNGDYSFINLDPSEYYLQFSNPPAGYMLTSQNQGGDDVSDSDPDATTGKTANFFVGVGLIEEGQDAGYKATGVGDFIWDDLNNNGDQDFGEPGVPGVTVQLVDAVTTTNVIAATSSDAYGAYMFASVTPGNYRIKVSNLPGGYQFVSQNAGANDDVDSDVNTTTGISDQVTVSTNTFNSSVDAGIYQPSGSIPEISVSANGVVIVDGDTSPGTADSTDFGSVSAASGDVTVTFTVANTVGTTDLTLNGSPAVAISGTHAADFTVTSAPTTTITSGSSTTFTITFDPSDNGLRSAIVSISNNDTDENPYDFDIQGTGLAPEIIVHGGDKDILDGDTTPSTSDDTDLGSQDIDTGSSSSVFKIKNTGAASLLLTGSSPYVTIGGTNAADFSISANPSTPIVAGDSTSFTVLFNPSAVGLRVATLSISTNDADENPFTFDVQGTGTSVPEIALQGNLNNIADGDTSPATSDLTDFGGRDIFAAQLAHSFTIQNVGSGDLSLTGLPMVQISGANAGDFIVSQQPASSTVSPSGSNTFQVAFDPTTTGVRVATVLISSDDADESPFSFAIQGLGTSTLDEEIEVLGNDVVIESGDIFPMSGDFTDVGSAEISGVPATTTYIIRNIGYAVLSLTGPPPYVSFTGANASEFNISSSPSNSIAIDSATTSFEVTFTPAGLGTRQATVNIQNDDSDENPYTFTIQGTGVYDALSLSEINITGNMINILDGDTSPHVSNGTAFGSVEVIGGLTATQEFVIHNLGSDDLVLGDNPIIAISGTHAGDFTVISNPATLVAPSSTVAFTVEFNPSGTGLREATISIGNSDPTGNENPYTFDIEGTGVTTPEMSVSGNSVTITSGDTSPGLSDSTMFGDVDITTGAQLVTYTISNSGNASLAIDSVSFSGAQASEFSVTTPPASSVITGNSTTMVVQFDPSSIGLRNATISIYNNDPDVSPYVFDLRGNGTSPSDGVIGNMVWLDNDGDGIQDAGEDPMSGITVSLYDSGDNLQGTAVSAADGSYSFAGLASGNYYLTFTGAPAGYSLSPLDQGGDDALDSDADPANSGKTATFFLNISGVDNTRDAGFKTTGVGDFVWLDVNEDGIQDVGETGVPGIDIEIKIDGGASVATTITDANGYYSFTNLSPNTYRLYFTGLPAGYVFSPQNSGGDDNLDSDINTGTGESGALVISSGVFLSNLDAGVYQQSAPEISIKGNNVDITDGDTSPSTLDHTDYGSIEAQIDSVIHTYKIFNGNGATLTLNGTPKVSISGTNADEFYVKVQPSETVASNDSTSFDIRFIPTTEGLRSATVSIANTDSDENPFTFDIRGFGLASEIQVSGNANVIVDGDVTPTASDFTDFGSEDILTGSQAQSFSILNTGNADLILSNPSTYVDITGDAAADFTVTSAPSSPVATNNSTTFTITFDPGSAGLRVATLSIANNDLDEDPYTFSIQGIGLATPEITVLGNGESISDGDSSPVNTDNTDFGSKDILAATQENTFYLKNIGSGVLTLSGNPLVVLSGTHAGDFLVSAQPVASSVAPGDSVAFTVTFNPTAVGLRTASLSIANDDDDENPFDFSIQGTGIASPEMSILGNGVSIVSGDVTPAVADSTIFEDTIIDSSSWVGYTIENTGSAILTLTDASPYITISGTHASDFALTLIPQSTISAGGGSTDFTIRFIPGAEGVRTATISIASDDTDENPYTFSISGTGLPMPLPELFLVETVDLNTALPGDTLTYTVTYSNVGVGIAKDVVVDQAVPQNATYVENSAVGTGMTITFQHVAAGGYDASQAAPVTDIKYERALDLATGENGTVTFKVVVD